ncbi:hypothetical protein [Clostridium brassicae]|uniref:Phage portal protein n=1 Tax=Clostridium brassicae TaxID=2999072 RepID=A0ABT4D9X5_9CLOT|nr:hypothetical protein [Clostridium brassicae]MCY6957961.1 hypothetical protein [Clostridium brassicae]
MENKLKKLTLDDFRKKALNKYNNRKKIVDLEIEGFGILTFIRPSDSQFLDFKEAFANSVTMSKDEDIRDVSYKTMLKASKEFLYKTCEFLHDSELQKDLECVEPYDICVKLFGIDDTISLARKVNDAFDIDTEEIKQSIKN